MKYCNNKQAMKFMFADMFYLNNCLHLQDRTVKIVEVHR